jgi:hypothetical protein
MVLRGLSPLMAASHLVFFNCAIAGFSKNVARRIKIIFFMRESFCLITWLPIVNALNKKRVASEYLFLKLTLFFLY